MQTKIIEILLVILLLGGGYFFVKNLREENAALKTALESTRSVLNNYDISVKAEAKSRTEYLQTLQEFRKIETPNRVAVAAGDKQLSVKATCPKTSDASNGSGATGALAILDPSVGQYYFDLRENITVNESKLTKCIADLESAIAEINRADAYACH